MIPPTVLESERLVLRPVEPADLDDMTTLFAHPGATEAMALGPELKTPEGVRRFVAAVVDSHRSNGPVVLLTILLKPSQEFAGACGLIKTMEAPYAECVYAISPTFQRKGLASEAVERLIRYALMETDLPEVVAHVIPANVPSVRVLEKIAPTTGMAARGLVAHPLYSEKVLSFSVLRADFLKASEATQKKGVPGSGTPSS